MISSMSEDIEILAKIHNSFDHCQWWCDIIIFFCSSLLLLYCHYLVLYFLLEKKLHTTINNDIRQIMVFIYIKKLFCQQIELICSDNMCYYCIVDHMLREKEINSYFANLWEPNHIPQTCCRIYHHARVQDYIQEP